MIHCMARSALRMRALWLALAATALLGCAPRFASIETGIYRCDVSVVSSTCGPDIPPVSRMVDVTGGELLSFLAPGALYAVDVASEGGWTSIQFGAQSDPMTYQTSGLVGCIDEAELLARVTRLGTNDFDVELRYDYARILDCGYANVTVDFCTAVVATSCTKLP